jgi:RNA polymerase sigma factor (sigma-70 family)
MATVFDFDASSESDADLLARLRDGDVDAYEVLWSRHIGAAMRQGRKLSPDHAEDLVSESFLAVLRQVTTTDAGPRTSFRAYLFTVMRNTAMRWGRAALRSVPDPEVDDVDDADPSLLHEEDSDATEILRAFRTLPARWQRVLWLTEVEQVPRPEIASELGIRPNAVSSLHRRARNGLREEWLSHQVPADLRDAPGHVGRDLPAYVAGAPDVDADRIRSHVGGCSRCADALAVLSTRNSRRADLGIGVLGFGALAVAASQSGASVPVAAASAGTGAAGASAAGTALGTAAGIGGSATSIAAIGSVAVLSIGAIAVSAIAATSNSTDPAGGTGARDFVEIVEPTVVSGPDAGGTPRTPPAVASAGPRATGVGAAPTDPGVVVAPGTDPGTEEVELAATGVSGRFAADPSVAAPYAGAPDVSAPASPAPTPTAPGTVPPPRTDPVERPSEEPTTGPVEEPSTGPVEEPTVEPDAESPEPPEPGSEEPTGEPTEEPTEDPTEEPTIPVAPDPITLELTTTSSTGFFAPVLTGTTQPGNLVAVEYAGEQYTVAPGADG